MSRSSVAACRILLLFAAVVILHLATTERVYPVVDDVNDKVSHVLAFAALALMSDFSFPSRRFGPAAALWLLGFGALIELVQHFLPYREASLFDLMADAVGIGAYWSSIPLLKRLPLLRRRWESASSGPAL